MKKKGCKSGDRNAGAGVSGPHPPLGLPPKPDHGRGSYIMINLLLISLGPGSQRERLLFQGVQDPMEVGRPPGKVGVASALGSRACPVTGTV